MQLPGLIGFISVLILACNSDDKGWKINVNNNITAHCGSNITIQCNFSYPQKYKTDNVTVYWKKNVIDKSGCSEKEKDKNAFVYHPNETCVLDNYKQKTKLIGDKDKGDCSLQITNIVIGDQKLYVRIHVKSQNYSYTKEFVTISLNGTGVESDTFKPVGTDCMTPAFSSSETTITNEKGRKSIGVTKTLYVAIPVAVAAVIILLVAGIFIFQKHKRSHSVTREDSGYYANFSRAISNPPKREACVNTQVKKLPEGKAIDDPVYINVKAPPGHMDQNMDCVDNIYANMDYRN